MNFPHEVPLSSAHPIIPRHREVERCAEMPRMREFSFLYTLLQPAESRGITQSAERLHLFGSDIVMLLEILHEQTVDFNVTDAIRTLGVLGAQELGRFQFPQQFIVSFIYYSFKLNAFCTDFMTVAHKWRLGTIYRKKKRRYPYYPYFFLYLCLQIKSI